MFHLNLLVAAIISLTSTLAFAEGISTHVLDLALGVGGKNTAATSP